MSEIKAGDVVCVVRGPKRELGKLRHVHAVCLTAPVPIVEVTFHDDEGTPCYTCGHLEDYAKAPVPPPGSNDALTIGCQCPVLDNAHGKGHMGLGKEYWYNLDCPVHKTSSTVSE